MKSLPWILLTALSVMTIGASPSFGQSELEVDELKKIIAIQQGQIADLMNIVNTVIDGDRWVGNPSGLKGDQGPRGANGPRGAPGAKGDRGPQGSTGVGCTVASVSGGVKITCGSRSKVVKHGVNAGKPYKYPDSESVALHLKDGLMMEFTPHGHCLYGKIRTNGSRPRIWCK